MRCIASLPFLYTNLCRAQYRIRPDSDLSHLESVFDFDRSDNLECIPACIGEIQIFYVCLHEITVISILFFVCFNVIII
jgi:hypothetical protein